MTNFQLKYQIISIIYNGRNSIIYKVYNKTNNNFYACKRITILENNVEKIHNEINIMDILKYDEDFIKLHEYFIDTFFCYIILELADGNILNYIKNNVVFEKDIKEIFMKILNSIKKLHEINIIHLDIKPDNILYVMKENKINIKICDFGNSVYNYNYNSNLTIDYTPEYASPELQKNIINKKNDIYSLGYILYKLLMDEIMYIDIKYNNFFDFKKTYSHLYEFHVNWSKISRNAKDLIKQMINKNYKLRPDINKCLNHKWFCN